MGGRRATAPAAGIDGMGLGETQLAHAPPPPCGADMAEGRGMDGPAGILCLRVTHRQVVLEGGAAPFGEHRIKTDRKREQQ